MRSIHTITVRNQKGRAYAVVLHPCDGYTEFTIISHGLDGSGSEWAGELLHGTQPGSMLDAISYFYGNWPYTY